LIADRPGLDALIERLSPLPTVALDTEADSLHCYFEKLCLIQLATPRENLLVDPLAGLPLQPLFDVLKNKRVVLHGADYDLRLFRRSGEFEVADIFDTMIAARLSGQSALGLAALVEKYFGVQLSKASQKANWALRPLPERMVSYALNDTRYLLDLAEILDGELRRLGRWEWFAQSRDRMVASTREVRPRDEEVIWRITGSSRLSPRAQSILRVLWFWRDVEAREWDRPPFHVVGNADLLNLADRAAHGEPFQVPRMPNRRRKSFDVALALALQVPESEWPVIERTRRRRVSKEEIRRLDELRKIRDRVAAEIDLEASIIAPKSGLEAVARDPGSDALMDWQRGLLGLAPATPAVPAEPSIA